MRETLHATGRRLRYGNFIGGTSAEVLQAVPGKNGLPVVTAASRVDVPSRGVDRSESSLMGMRKVTGGVFRVYSKPF